MRVQAMAMMCAFDVDPGASHSRGVPLLLIGSAHSTRLVMNTEVVAAESGRAEECCMLAVATTPFVTFLLFKVFLPVTKGIELVVRRTAFLIPFFQTGDE